MYSYPQIPSSSEGSIIVWFVPDRGGEQLGLGGCCDIETEGNYIRQVAYDRLHDKFKLQKDSDGMLNLSFSDKTKTRIVDRRFSVVPDSYGLADVVFGREPPRTPTEDVEEGSDGIEKLLCVSPIVLIVVTDNFDSTSNQVCKTFQAAIDNFNTPHEKQRLEALLSNGIGTMLSPHASSAYDSKKNAKQSGATYFHAFKGALEAAAAAETPQKS